MNINERIREIVTTLLGTVVDDDVELKSVGMDSMMFVSLIVCLEEQFLIEIPDEFFLMEKMKTIREIGEIINETLEEQNRK